MNTTPYPCCHYGIEFSQEILENSEFWYKIQCSAPHCFRKLTIHSTNEKPWDELVQSWNSSYYIHVGDNYEAYLDPHTQDYFSWTLR